MILVIDIGNTFVKLAVFNKGKMLIKKQLKTSELAIVLQDYYSEYKFANAIVSNVGKLKKNIFKGLEKVNFIFLDHKTPVPFTNNYATPHTLGVDRIALAVAAVTEYPNQNCLVIDAGTCVTYDFVSKRGEYLGGAISAGLSMRYKALNHFTESLPLLAKNSIAKTVGTTTDESIAIGVEKGISYEIDGFIDDFRNHYANFIIILTGGDAKHLSKSIKSSIFVRPNFLMEGLYKIVAYNLSL